MVITTRQSSPLKKLFTGGRLEIQHSNNNAAPFTAFSLSVAQGRALSICTLALYFLTLNLSSVFYQLRGAAPEHYLFSAVSTFSGVLVGGLLMDAVERRCSGPRGVAWRFGFLAVLLLPGAFGLISFSLVDFSGNLFLNSFQPGLWFLPLAPVLRLFFRHEFSLGGRALWLGLAFGAGHLCWALVLPLSRFMMRPGVAENSTLISLNVTRCLLACVIGCMAWKTLDLLTAKEPKPQPSLPTVSEPSFRRKATFLLLAFLPCALLNGTLGFVLFARSTTHGVFPELMQITMVFLFPLAGLWLAGRAGRLRLLLSAFILCFVFAPILLPESAPLPSWLRQMTLFLCIICLQGLYFGGTLCMAAMGPRLSRPSLALISVWFIPVTALAVPGLRALLKDFSSFNQWLCIILALACVGSVLLLRWVFPLPEVACRLEDTATEQISEGAAQQVEGDTESLVRLAAFAAAFRLSKRETETLEALIRHGYSAPMTEALGVSERTTRHHLGNIIRKTGTSSRRGLELRYHSWRL